MKTECVSAIKSLADKSGKADKPDDAMKFAQSALNLVHVLATLDNMKYKQELEDDEASARNEENNQKTN